MNKHTLVWIIIGATVSAAGLYLNLRNFPLGELGRDMMRINTACTLGGAALLGDSRFGYVPRWQLILRTHIRLAKQQELL